MQPDTDISVDTAVSIHPRRIRSISEIEETLARINAYERIVGVTAGVIVIQNRQLGGSYRIMPETEALEMKANLGACERTIGYYPRSYFEGLKQSLSDETSKH